MGQSAAKAVSGMRDLKSMVVEDPKPNALPLGMHLVPGKVEIDWTKDLNDVLVDGSVLVIPERCNELDR